MKVVICSPNPVNNSAVYDIFVEYLKGKGIRYETRIPGFTYFTIRVARGARGSYIYFGDFKIHGKRHYKFVSWDYPDISDPKFDPNRFFSEIIGDGS